MALALSTTLTRTFSELYSHRTAGGSFVRIPPNTPKHLLAINTTFIQIPFRPAKLPDIGSLFTTDSHETSALHRDPPAPQLRGRGIVGHHHAMERDFGTAESPE